MLYNEHLKNNNLPVEVHFFSECNIQLVTPNLSRSWAAYLTRESLKKILFNVCKFYMHKFRPFP